jgi:hypothetical protein
MGPELPFEAVQAFAAFDPARMQAENEWRSFIVAVRGDLLIGVMQVGDDQITNLHVDPTSWNEGAGSKLLVAAELDPACDLTSHLVRLQAAVAMPPDFLLRGIKAKSAVRRTRADARRKVRKFSASSRLMPQATGSWSCTTM